MENKDKPIFPTEVDLYAKNGKVIIIETKEGNPFFIGLTKFEYFIAHAPTVIPGWFLPKMRELPKKPPYVSNLFGKDSNHPDKELFRKCYNSEERVWYDEVSIPQQLKDDVAKAEEAMDDWAGADTQWYRDQARELVIQWPIFWATEILKKLDS